MPFGSSHGLVARRLVGGWVVWWAGLADEGPFFRDGLNLHQCLRHAYVGCLFAAALCLW
jgi:hypothetical protein